MISDILFIGVWLFIVPALVLFALLHLLEWLFPPYERVPVRTEDDK